MRPFKPRFRIRGNFRARAARSNLRGSGRGSDMHPSENMDRDDEHGIDRRSPPSFETGSRREKSDERNRYVDYDRRSSSREYCGQYSEKKYADHYSSSSRRRSRSPYHDYYRNKSDSHLSRYKSHSRSRSRSPYGRSNSPSPKSHRSRSPSPPRRSRCSPNYEKESDKYRRRSTDSRSYENKRVFSSEEIDRQSPLHKLEAVEEAYESKSSSLDKKEYKHLEHFQESPVLHSRDRSPVTNFRLESTSRYSEFDKDIEDRKEKTFRDKFAMTFVEDVPHHSLRNRSLDELERSYRKEPNRESPLRVPSMFLSESKSNREFSLSVPWNCSPPSKLSDNLAQEGRSTIKSILKKSSSITQQDDDSRSTQSSTIHRLSLDTPSSTAATTIPGLGDIEVIEDEEKFLYGDEAFNISVNRTVSYREQKDYDRDVFLRRTSGNDGGKDDERWFRNLSPVRNYRNISPISKKEIISPRFCNEFSPSLKSRQLREHSPLRLLSDEMSYKKECLIRQEVKERPKERSNVHEDNDTFKPSDKQLEDVLKSIGIEMVRQLQKRQDDAIASPRKEETDENAKLYGIKSDMQNSSFFDHTHDQVKSDLKNLIRSVIPTNDAARQTHQLPSNQTSSFTSDSFYPNYDVSLSQQNYHPYPETYSNPTHESSSSSISYYDYSKGVYSSSAYNVSANSTQRPTDNRVNLRVIPIQATETSVSKTDQSCHVQVAKPAESDQKTKISLVEIQSLIRQKDNQLNRLGMMEKEIERLRKQQGELMRKKQKQKDGHKDPLLVENSKLQDEIGRQISSIKVVISDLNEKLKEGGCETASNLDKLEKKTQDLPEETITENAFESETELEYIYFDPGNHWCKQCNKILPHLHNMFQHLQEKKHLQGMNPQDRPWLEHVKKPSTTKSSKKPLMASVKGLQFLMPVSAFYCSLCCEFMGDAACAELHVKSKNHNFKYLKYVLENPYYERCWNLDRAAGISVKTEEMKRSWLENEKKQKAKRKKLEIEAEQKNRDLIRAEAERDKKVSELDESLSDAPSRKLDKSKGKEIKLTLKGNEKRLDVKTKSGADRGFGKFTWPKKENPEAKTENVIQVKDLQKVPPKEPLEKDPNASKIAIRLSAKNVPSYAAPWQTIRKSLMQQKKTAVAVSQPVQTVGFPLRKNKNEQQQAVETKTVESTVDIFMSNEPPPPGTTQDIYLPNANSSTVPEVIDFAPSKVDIANAFGGKFKPDVTKSNINQDQDKAKCVENSPDVEIIDILTNVDSTKMKPMFGPTLPPSDNQLINKNEKEKEIESEVASKSETEFNFENGPPKSVSKDQSDECSVTETENDLPTLVIGSVFSLSGTSEDTNMAEIEMDGVKTIIENTQTTNEGHQQPENSELQYDVIANKIGITYKDNSSGNIMTLSDERQEKIIDGNLSLDSKMEVDVSKNGSNGSNP